MLGHETWLLLLISVSTATGLSIFGLGVSASRAICIAGSSFGQEDNLGDGPARDCAMFGKALEAKGVRVSYALVRPKEGSSRDEVLAVLRTTFRKPSQGLNIIFYSGHGIAGNEDDGTRGALCVGNPPDWSRLTLAELRVAASRRGAELVGHRGRRKTYVDACNRAYLLTLDDILEFWDGVRGAAEGAKGARLLVVADSCYSGKLVARLRRLPNMAVEGVAIQSAGNARQTVGQPLYAFTHGGTRYENVGCLTAYLTAKQEVGAHVRWTQRGQYPQFYATWDREAAEKPSVALDLGTGFALRTISQPDRR